MHRYRLAALLLAFPLSCGCTDDKLIAPAEPVIAEGADGDFGVEGLWHQVLDPRTSHLESPPELIVKRSQQAGTYQAVLSPHQDSTTSGLRFRLVKARDDSDHLIVEVELELDGTTFGRSLYLALRDGDKLYLWPLQSKNLIKCLRADNHSAVLEQHSMSTTVHADGDELLKTIGRHANDLVGEPMTFLRAKHTPDATPPAENKSP